MSERRTLGVALAALLLLPLACSKKTTTTGVRTDKGTIRGIVADAGTRDPVEKAMVKAGGETQLTDAEGKYEISLPPGSYRVSVSRDGYKDYRSLSEIDVKDGVFSTHDVLLEEVDVEPPVVRIDRAPPALTREDSVEFAWSLAKGGSGGETTFASRLEGAEATFGPYKPASERRFTDLPDGTYVFEVRARDEAKQLEGKAARHAFKVDSTPPLDPSILPAGGEKTTASRAVDLVLSAEEADEMAVWEGPEPSKPRWIPYREKKSFVLGATEGERIVSARFRDRAGNETDAVSCSLILDTQPPTPPGNLRAEAEGAEEVRLTWNASRDEGSGVKSYTVLRDGMEVGKTRTITFVDRTVKLGGGYVYSVTATDGVERTSDPSPGVAVKVMGLPPVTPCAPAPNDGAEDCPTGLTLTWTGGDPDRGDQVTYDLYLGPNPSPPLRASGLTTPSFPVSDLKPSTTYHWRVEAKDLQGLKAKGPAWTFTTAEKPNTTPSAHVAATPTTGKTGTVFRFDASASKDAEDPVALLRLRWDLDGDGKPDTEWTGTKTVEKTFPEIGSHTVTVFVKDLQGAEAKASARVEVENSAPVLSGDPKPLNGSMGEPADVALGWTFSDPDPGDAMTYDVYLGSAEGDLRAVARGIDASTFAPPEPLDRGEVYYWRVNATDGHGATTQGPIWSFATAKGVKKEPFRAVIAWKPKKGKTMTPFRFDASGSTDPEDPPDALKVRWDFDGDGEPDMDWTTKKTAVKTFGEVGEAKVTLEVLNTRGETATASVTIPVENTAPDFVGEPRPGNGAAGVSRDAGLAWNVSDPDPKDKVVFEIFLGRAGKPLASLEQGLTESAYQPKKELSPGVYNWKVKAEDRYGGKAESPVWTFKVKERDNRPPLRPVVKGPGEVRVGESAGFSARSRDLEKDPIRIRFDWGDGTISPWSETGPEGSASRSHIWALQGEYAVTAQAADALEAESHWSHARTVRVLPPVEPGDEEDLWHWDPVVMREMPDLFTLKARYWFANLGGSGQWKGVGDPQADLSFGPDLGITERQGAPWVHAEIGQYISGGLEYFMLAYGGATTFATPSTFGGTTFPASTDADTLCRIRFGQIYATFNPYLGHYIGGGVKLGAGYFWNRTSISAPSVGPRRDETLEFPVPVLGVRLYGTVTKYFRVHFEFSYIEGGLQEFDLRSGRVIDVAGDVTFTPVHFIGIALGYRYTGIKARVQHGTGVSDTQLDLTLDGIHLSVTAHF